MATVVRREPPSSAHVGDAAIITPDGAFFGWLGGSCTHELVVAEALAALTASRPGLIALSADADAEDLRGISVLPMTCHSGGSVEVYLEPVLPGPRLVVFGATPLALALVRLGRVLDYRVEIVDPDADETTFGEADLVLREHARLERTHRGVRTCAVIATHGRHDEASIRAALDLEPEHCCVVASRRRFAVLRETLLSEGVPLDRLEAIENPAGLDIGARTPEEVALSILASVVQAFAGPASLAGSSESGAELERSDHERTEPEPTDLERTGEETGAVVTENSRDPVCGMTVDPATATARAELDGQAYVFCCDGCRRRFVADPEPFLARIDGTEPA